MTNSIWQDPFERFRQDVIAAGGRIEQVQAFEEPSTEDFLRITIGDRSWDIHDMADLVDRYVGMLAPDSNSLNIQAAIAERNGR